MAWLVELDRAFEHQHALCEAVMHRSEVLDWGRRVRLCCSWRRFRALSRYLHSVNRSSSLCFLGSGDFHHVSLAMLERIGEPFNLLVFDNHPDWMRGISFLHCGTWLYHAARLPLVHRVFHVGGDLDFDNHYSRLAPWKLLHEGKIRVLSSRRRFSGGGWDQIAHPFAAELATSWKPIATWEADLRAHPLYVSFDKDVLSINTACTNWEHGYLSLEQAWRILNRCADLAPRLIGMDIVGDWSPVETEGLGRKLMHVLMHPRQSVDPAVAAWENERLNLRFHSWWQDRASSHGHRLSTVA